LNADQTAEENAVGIPAIQANINDLNTQYTDLENQIQQSEAQEASKPGVVASIINGRMKMISAQDANAMANLKAQITAANTQLTQANAVVSTFMSNDKANYTDAATAYNSAFTQAMALYNAQETQQDKVTTSAQANLKVLMDYYTSKNITTIDPSQAANIATMETQAGWPPGTLENMITTAAQTGGKFSAPIRNATTGEVYSVLTSADGKTQTLVDVGNTGSDNGGTLTTNQQTIITGLNNEIAASAAGKSFPAIADLYASVANIDPNTTDPVKQGQIMLALAQIEVPGAKTVRSALSTAASASGMDSGVYNMLVNAEKVFEQKGSLSPSIVSSMMDTMNSIYQSQESSYTQARNAAVQGAVARGITGADQYITNYAADSGASEAFAKNAINTYMKNNPKMLQKVTQALQIPGLTESDLLQYMKDPSSGFDNYGDLP
jgi:hypothetical protein